MKLLELPNLHNTLRKLPRATESTYHAENTTQSYWTYIPCWEHYGSKTFSWCSSLHQTVKYIENIPRTQSTVESSLLALGDGNWKMGEGVQVGKGARTDEADHSNIIEHFVCKSTVFSHSPCRAKWVVDDVVITAMRKKWPKWLVIMTYVASQEGTQKTALSKWIPLLFYYRQLSFYTTVKISNIW